MTIACPKCASTEVRKLSLIYNEGLSHINTQSVSVGSGFGGGGMATASTGTVGQAQTALSKKAAPPPQKLWYLWAAGAGIFALFTLGALRHFSILEILIYGGLAAFMGQKAMKGKAFNENERPGLLARWEQSWMCNRCGEIFQAT